MLVGLLVGATGCSVSASPAPADDAVNETSTRSSDGSADGPSAATYEPADRTVDRPDSATPQSNPTPSNMDSSGTSFVPVAPDVFDLATSDSMFGSVPCEPIEGEIKLSNHIYPPDMFDTIVPMGRMWDSHVTPTDHLYWTVNEARERGMVLSPADGRLIRIERFPNDQAPQWDSSIVEPDIRMVIAHSCDLFSIFIHVGALAPEIASVVGELAMGEQWQAKQDEVVELKAGDPIAGFGGSAIDYSLHDGRMQLAGFQVPEHYEGEPWKVHTVDPFDYMTDELISDLLPKNERTVAPYGGRIDYDVRGSLAGNWFMDGTVDYRGGESPGAKYWNGHMAIAYDHIDPSQLRISIGRDIGITYDDCRLCGGVYAVKGNAPDPSQVTFADGLVKYELTGRQHSSPDSREKSESDGVVLGTFLAQVLDDTSIRTEFFKGLLADGVSDFTDNAVVYRR